MTPMRILVTGANGDIGLAIGRILHVSYPAAELIGADAAGEWPAAAIYSHVHALPWADDPAFPAAFAALADRVNPTVIIVYSEAELRCLATNHDRIAQLPVLMPSPEVIGTFCDKLTTAQWLRDRGFPVPLTKRLAEAVAVDLPLIIKPRLGSGSRRIEIVETAARLDLVKSERRDDAIAQGYVGTADAEYTCAVIRLDGKVRTLTMQRWLVGGMSGRIIVKSVPAVESLLVSIAEAADLSGVLNVQLRLTDAGPMIFEINPRLSSTVMMRHRIGFRDLCWMIDHRCGISMPAFSVVPETQVFRISDEVVVPPC